MQDTDNILQFLRELATTLVLLSKLIGRILSRKRPKKRRGR